MIRSILLILAALLGVPQWTTPLHVPFVASGGGGTPSYSGVHCMLLSNSCTVTATAGQTLVIVANNYASGSMTISDSNGTPVACSGYPYAWNSGAFTQGVWYEQGVASGTHTFTLSVTTVSYEALAVVAATTSSTVSCSQASYFAEGNSNTFTGKTFSNSGSALVFSFTNQYAGPTPVTGTGTFAVTKIDDVGGELADAYGTAPSGSNNTVWNGTGGASNWAVAEVVIQ